MNIKKLTTKTTQLIKDMEKNSLVTFGTNPTEFYEIDGEKFAAKPFSCYNWKIVLDGEQVIINPAMYDGDLKQVNADGDLWIFYNTNKALLYDNPNGWLGVVSEDLDPLTHSERVAKYLAKIED